MNKRILIVDDEESVLNTLKRLFRNKPYDVRVATSAEDGLFLLGEETADLIISDMRMPEMDGAQFLAIAKERYPMTERILLTGYSDMESTVKAINDGGIFGYISKPWNVEQMLALVENALDKTHKNRLKNRTLKRFKRENKVLELDLERKQREMVQSAEFVDQAFQKLKDNYHVTELMLLNLLDMKCRGEREFAHKVARLTQQVCELLGFNEEESLTLSVASRLHGVGKIGVPDKILDKPLEALTEEELSAYRQYPSNGACALMSYLGFQDVAQVIFEQKEYLDGSGYPNGLVGDEISRAGRVLSLILDYAQLRFEKSTGSSLSHEQSMAVIERNSQKYDATLLPTLSSLTLEVESSDEATAMVLPLFSLKEGMILNKDIFTDANILLLPQGSILTEGMIGHLLTIERNSDRKMLISVRFDQDETGTTGSDS